MMWTRTSWTRLVSYLGIMRILLVGNIPLRKIPSIASTTRTLPSINFEVHHGYHHAHLGHSSAATLALCSKRALQPSCSSPVTSGYRLGEAIEKDMPLRRGAEFFVESLCTRAEPSQGLDHDT